jgi:hypothetical protein
VGNTIDLEAERTVLAELVDKHGAALGADFYLVIFLGIS